ncbi:hypothetical protein [Sediminibacterium sp.]|uniref:hypothetical protein n=1 Tax=Sediminibacterium sp. TaxID=1917865 RepID=UPI0025F74FA8|nr:hypothetical protein [Sediminibacterium sp.]MBW0179193.1 hypothetical protein [Sediminibacterium sp.]
MRNLATSSTAVNRQGTVTRVSKSTDSLGKALRNKKEAEQFIADMEAAFEVAGKKKK